jgi:hypothetical protein
MADVSIAGRKKMKAALLSSAPDVAYLAPSAKPNASSANT